MRLQARRRNDAYELALGYLSPGWVGFVLELRAMARMGLWLAFAVYVVFFADWPRTLDLSMIGGPAVLSMGQAFITEMALAAASYWPISLLVTWAGDALMRSEPWLRRRMRLVLAPDMVGIRQRGRWIWLDRDDGAVEFREEPHRQAIREAREEQRVGQDSRVPYVYRDAREIWAQQELNLFVIGEAADETEARAIVRTLQHYSALAMKGIEGSRTLDPFGAEPEI